MKKFTIVFPTRDRLGLLRTLLSSIERNTNNLDDIEVLIAIDHDDKNIDYVMEFNCSWVKFFGRPRSLNFSKDYYNFLASQGTGRYIIACNDDGVFETKDWDVLAWDVLERFVADGPTVVHGWIEDHLHDYRAKGHGKYCCFPLIGRDGFNALGGMVFPDRIPTWGADIWTRKLYDNIDRVVDLPITIRHVCYHNNTRERDSVNLRIADNQVGYDINPTYNEINALIAGMRPKTAKVI